MINMIRIRRLVLKVDDISSKLSSTQQLNNIAPVSGMFVYNFSLFPFASAVNNHFVTNIILLGYMDTFLSKAIAGRELRGAGLYNTTYASSKLPAFKRVQWIVVPKDDSRYSMSAEYLS
ncbi:Inactive leucine-rich repeat receptor-like serine/threonine-protein kinase [Frankliniella fusca]|uniref:Inactive leucine-rich repeat receptor-like serine/threonine-protein kinase n=1 Tax=Frankliniella fusca TaxID=407009 RepID=A0AAE1L7P5_9NEOP|nr:Inactive leucine-rich repeat receptor-like serine/threonine-protein kinase [Frankliniella fusca]